MKRAYTFISLWVAGILICFVSMGYAQCGGFYNGQQVGMKCQGPSGIAIVKADSNGNFAAPGKAMTFPKFKGGNKAINTFVHKNKIYPADLKSQGIEGTAYVQAIVKADGSVADAEIVKSSGYKQFDDEALRLVQSFPAMEPATQDGKAIDFIVQFPIPFCKDKK